MSFFGKFAQFHHSWGPLQPVSKASWILTSSWSPLFEKFEEPKIWRRRGLSPLPKQQNCCLSFLGVLREYTKSEPPSFWDLPSIEHSYNPDGHPPPLFSPLGFSWLCLQQSAQTPWWHAARGWSPLVFFLSYYYFFGGLYVLNTTSKPRKALNAQVVEDPDTPIHGIETSRSEDIESTWTSSAFKEPFLKNIQGQLKQQLLCQNATLRTAFHCCRWWSEVHDFGA